MRVRKEAGKENHRRPAGRIEDQGQLETMDLEPQHILQQDFFVAISCQGVGVEKVDSWILFLGSLKS